MTKRIAGGWCLLLAATTAIAQTLPTPVDKDPPLYRLPPNDLPPPLWMKNSLPLPAPTPAPVPVPDSTSLRNALEDLKNARKDLANQRDKANELIQGSSVADEMARIQLRLRVQELLRKLGDKSVPVKPTTPVRPPEPTRAGPGTPPPPLTETMTDPVALAQAQFRAGQFDAALKSLQAVDSSTLSRKDQVWVRYLTACCLRRQGKLSDAATIYREIAASREDSFLTDSAVWHLNFLNWRDEMQKSIDALRKQP
jgi:hypothetical protein